MQNETANQMAMPQAIEQGLGTGGEEEVQTPTPRTPTVQQPV